MTAGSTSRMMAINVHGLHAELKLMQKIGGQWIPLCISRIMVPPLPLRPKQCSQLLWFPNPLGKKMVSDPPRVSIMQINPLGKSLHLHKEVDIFKSILYKDCYIFTMILFFIICLGDVNLLYQPYSQQFQDISNNVQFKKIKKEQVKANYQLQFLVKNKNIFKLPLVDCLHQYSLCDQKLFKVVVKENHF